MKDRTPGMGGREDGQNRVLILADGTVEGQIADHDYQPPIRIPLGAITIHDKDGELKDMAPNPSVPNSIVRFDSKTGAVQVRDGTIVRKETPIVTPVTVIFQQRSK